MTLRFVRTGFWSLALLLAATAADAQSNSAMAESLFRDGKKLLEERRFDEACPKFKESSRLDPSSGVELALGLCYEGQGKTASAWGAYVTAASLARRDGRHDRELAANKHAQALEPKLSHVTLVVAPETVAVAGLTVKQDGIVVGSETWKGAPADPGTHALEVTAPGKKPYTATFLVDPADQATVNIPALVNLPQAPGLVAVGYSPAPTSNLYRQVGFGVGTAGVVTLALGTILGIVALHDASAAHAACPSSPCGNAGGVSLNGTAATTADWSTATLIAGGVAVAGGAALVFVLGRSRESAPASTGSVTPLLGPGFAGLSGRF
jgi:hypothetical protein